MTMSCRATQDEQVMVQSSDKTWSTWEGNGKPLQYSCHLFLISSASVRSLPFLSFIMPILAQNISLIPSIFLRRSLLFPILLFSPVSLHCSLKKASDLSWLLSGTLHSVGYIFPLLSCFLLLFFPQLFVRPPQITTLPSWHFFFFRMILVTASYTVLWIYIVLWALCLSDVIPSVYSSLPLYNHKGFDLGHT